MTAFSLRTVESISLGFGSSHMREKIVNLFLFQVDNLFPHMLHLTQNNENRRKEHTNNEVNEAIIHTPGVPSDKNL